jgi:hypothetical protein
LEGSRDDPGYAMAFSDVLSVYHHIQCSIGFQIALVEKTTNEFLYYPDVKYTTSGIWKGAEMIQAMPMAFSNAISVYHHIQCSIGFQIALVEKTTNEFLC